MAYGGAFVLTSLRPLWITPLTLREWQLLCRIVSAGLGPELACIRDGQSVLSRQQQAGTICWSGLRTFVPGQSEYVPLRDWSHY